AGGGSWHGRASPRPAKPRQHPPPCPPPQGGRGRTADRLPYEASREMSAFAALLVRTISLSLKIGGGALTGLLFFLATVSVFPFGVGPDLNLLARIGPAILWITALLATLLGLDRLF